MITACTSVGVSFWLCFCSSDPIPPELLVFWFLVFWFLLVPSVPCVLVHPTLFPLAAERGSWHRLLSSAPVPAGPWTVPGPHPGAAGTRAWHSRLNPALLVSVIQLVVVPVFWGGWEGCGGWGGKGLVGWGAAGEEQWQAGERGVSWGGVTNLGGEQPGEPGEHCCFALQWATALSPLFQW